MNYWAIDVDESLERLSPSALRQAHYVRLEVLLLFIIRYLLFRAVNAKCGKLSNKAGTLKVQTPEKILCVAFE